MLVAGLMCGFTLWNTTSSFAGDEPMPKDMFQVLNVTPKLSKDAFNVVDKKCECKNCTCPKGECKCKDGKCACLNCGAKKPFTACQCKDCKCGKNCKCQLGECKCPNCVKMVENPFKVTGKTPSSWSKLYNHVANGGTGTLYIGATYPTDDKGVWYHSPVSILGLSDGVYIVHLVNGQNVVESKLSKSNPSCIGGNCSNGGCPSGNCPTYRVSPQIQWQNQCPNCPNYRP